MKISNFIRQMFGSTSKKQESDSFADLQSTNMPEEIAIRHAILKITQYFDSEHQFALLAQQTARSLSADQLYLLPKYLYLDPNPDSFTSPSIQDSDVLEVWKDISQNSVIEIMYYCGEPAVDLVYNMLHTSDRWIQHKLYGLLCRWAADGVKREEIMRFLLQRSKTMNTDQLISLTHYLSGIKNDKQVDTVFDQLLDQMFDHPHLTRERATVALNLVRRWSRSNPVKAKEYSSFLYSMAKNELEVLNEETQETLQVRWPLNRRLGAALTYYKLNPQHKKIQRILEKLMEETNDTETQSYILEQMNVRVSA